MTDYLIYNSKIWYIITSGYVLYEYANIRVRFLHVWPMWQLIWPQNTLPPKVIFFGIFMKNYMNILFSHLNLFNLPEFIVLYVIWCAESDKPGFRFIPRTYNSQNSKWRPKSDVFRPKIVFGWGKKKPCPHPKSHKIFQTQYFWKPIWLAYILKEVHVTFLLTSLFYKPY